MTLARRKILIAGMGTSPAVLTNVVWALGCSQKPVSKRYNLKPSKKGVLK